MSTAQNPANKPEAVPKARTRIPMSVPQRRLETPDLPGFHLHWFIDRNIERAQQAGYEFVKRDELSLNQLGVATDRSVSGNADLGSMVRLVGGAAEQGGVEHLTLMKIPLDWWLEDQQKLETRNASIMQAIFKDEKVIGSDRQSAEDRATSYVKTALFQRPTRKGK